MKRSIIGFVSKISHFIPNNEICHTLAPKECKASNIVEIGTLTWFCDSVKLSELQINVILKAGCRVFTNSSLNATLWCSSLSTYILTTMGSEITWSQSSNSGRFLTSTLQFAGRTIIPNNAGKSLVSIMKQVASKSIYFGSLISGCSNKLMFGPLKGENRTKGACILLTKGVWTYKHFKVEVGWTEIIDGRVCAIGPCESYRHNHVR